MQNIDLYYDTPEQWERVYGENGDLKTCAEKEAVLQVKKKKMYNKNKMRRVVFEQ